jgi:tetratricopeptide (TPR) repeat protein
MVQKTKLQNTKQLVINKAIDLVYQAKLTTALTLIKKNFKADDSIFLFFKGWIAQINNEHDKAIKYLERSLTKNPLNQDALIGLSASYTELGDFDRALECAEQCVLLDKNDPRNLTTLATITAKKYRGNIEKQQKAIDLYLQAFEIVSTLSIPSEENTRLVLDILSGWGASLLDSKKPEEAILVLEAALNINDIDPLVHKNLASAYTSINKIDKAILSCQKAQMSDDTTIVYDALYQEGMLELMNGNYAKGWRLHEFRLKTSQFKDIRSLEVPQWDGRPLKEHESLLIYQEQGIGDTLQFSRYIPLIASRVKNIDIEVKPNHYQPWEDAHKEPSSIRAFLHGNYPQLRNSFVKGWDTVEYNDYTYITSFMSLPRLFKTTLSNIPDIPYFKPINSTIQSKKYDIGILWQGSKAHRNDINRSMPKEYLSEILKKHKDKSFLSLQLEYYQELHEYTNLDQIGNSIKNIDDTLTFINNCSIIVTVDSMVAHLAASANKPVLLLHAYSPDWRWMLDRRDSPWYPSIVNLRQVEVNNWNNIISEVNKEIDKLFQIEIKLD